MKEGKELSVRAATLDDLDRINEIYNHAVATTTATFDTEPKSPEERRTWFLHHDSAHPVLVAENKDGVCGWASLSRYSDRAAYDGTAEISIYVSEECRGKGVGRTLMSGVLEEARKAGLLTILARITTDNPVSVRLHQSAGFEMVGTMREVGFKFGRLLDVHLMQLILPGHKSARP